MATIKHRYISPLTLCLLGIRIVLGGVFIYSGVLKIVDPAEFAQAIANYQLIPIVSGNLMALFLPWLELVCGLCLISGLMLGTSAAIVAAMLVIFMGAITISLFRGIDIHCGCFGSGELLSSSMYIDLARDAVLLAMAVFVAFKTGPMVWRRAPAETD